MQEKLREQVKIMKAINGDIITYKEVAEYLEISINGFYNWLNGAYNLSYNKQKKLEELVSNMLT